MRLCVSRSAIAKWETDKGLPDVENLKLLARLLGVSVDSLLDDGLATEPALRRGCFSLASLGRGCEKVKKGRLLQSLFPDAKIWPLQGRPEVNPEDTAHGDRGFLTPLPFGGPEFLKSIRSPGRDFYLVEQTSGQLFVTVTDSMWEAHPLPHPILDNHFTLGQWHFVRCGHLTDSTPL